MTRGRALLAGLFVVLGAGAVSAAPAEPRDQHATAGARPMMAGHETMAASAKRLDELVAAMNAATGADKVERMAAVLTELVGQHKAMCGGMMAMPGMPTPGMMPPGTALPSATPSSPSAPPAAPPAAPAPPAEHEQHHPAGR